MFTPHTFTQRARVFRVWALGCLCWMLGAAVHATSVLRCQFEVNAQTYQHDFKPVSDPYRVASVDLGGRFRFKAVVLGDDQHVRLINLYASYQTRRQPMILQQVQYESPVPQRDPPPDALTGRVFLYSPFLGKELQYACALHEVTP